MTVTIDLIVLLKVLAVLVFGGAGVTMVVLVVQGVRRFLASRGYDETDREAMRSRWKEIDALLDQSGALSVKLAVIEADKLLDHALKMRAMPGTTLGERLKFAQYKYPKLRDVWWAHKVRNQLVHEAAYALDRGVARKAVRAFERALKLIGAI